MFETSVVRARAQAAGERLSLLTISIIAHSAVIVGAITVSLASVDFPTMAPDEYRTAPMFAAVTLPPPLGTPQGNNRPVQQPVQKQQATPVTKEVTAPPTVPETVTPVDAPATTLAEGSNTSDGPAGTGPRGVPDGDPNSIETNLDLPTVVAPGPQAGKIYEAYEVKSPVLLQRIDPPYPPILVRTGASAMVIVRCIIDKNGRVRDPEILLPAKLSPFNDAVINAVQKWRYTPGSLNGEAVETYLNVTVHFSVTR